MGTFLIIALLLAGSAWGLKAWRKRELDKFRQADVAMLSELKRDHGIESPPAVTLAGHDNSANTAAQLAPVEEDALPDLSEPASVRAIVLSERHRRLLNQLESLISERHRVFVNLPMSDVFETGMSTAISFVVCDRHYLSVELVLEFEDRLSTRLEMALKKVRKPLILINKSESSSSLKAKLEKASKGLVANAPPCPKCSGNMELRAPTSGKNAGKSFWVCRSYPGCKGAQTA